MNIQYSEELARFLGAMPSHRQMQHYVQSLEQRLAPTPQQQTDYLYLRTLLQQRTNSRRWTLTTTLFTCLFLVLACTRTGPDPLSGEDLGVTLITGRVDQSDWTVSEIYWDGNFCDLPPQPVEFYWCTSDIVYQQREYRLMFYATNGWHGKTEILHGYAYPMELVPLIHKHKQPNFH